MSPFYQHLQIKCEMSVYFQMKFVTQKVLEKQKAIVFFLFSTHYFKTDVKTYIYGNGALCTIN